MLFFFTIFEQKYYVTKCPNNYLELFSLIKYIINIISDYIEDKCSKTKMESLIITSLFKYLNFQKLVMDSFSKKKIKIGMYILL